ncbi:MAG TPA: hypothetical protein PL131_01720 [Methylotenera sp.]|nr:hypothetical protein [Methylotenera sp.]HPH04564.1 hypothetical protein [Methylotenera sp.]
MIIFIGVVSYGAYHHFSQRAVTHGVGEIAANTPLQNNASAGAVQLNGFTITPLMDYSIEARVLSKEDYSFGTEAEISPTDLALGWGPMSNEAVLSKIEISQGNRFFYWRVNEFPIPQREIEVHAANTHIIPANSLVERQLKSVRKGQLVKLKGQLVEVSRADGWHWRSSLTREDTGNGACELMYVTELFIK